MLISNADVKNYLGIVGSGEEDKITLVVKLACAAVANFLGWAVEEADYTEIYDGGRRIYRLKAEPISTAENKTIKVQYNGGTVSTPNWLDMPTSDYQVEHAEGVVEVLVPNVYSYDNFMRLKFIYTGGYGADAIPTDIQLCAIGLASRLYNRSKAEGLASEAIENANVTYVQGLLNADEKLTLQKYQRTKLVG